MVLTKLATYFWAVLGDREEKEESLLGYKLHGDKNVSVYSALKIVLGIQRC